MKKTALVFSTLLSLSAVANDFHYRDSSAQTSVFNPHPMADDLILPLPCENPDYFIVFRKVYTHLPEQKDLTLSLNFKDGSSEAQNSSVQSERQCKVRGNFKDEKGYFFYLSKYELTAAQFESISKGKCKDKVKNTDALAVSNISIDEAKEAARRYSDFLQTSIKVPLSGNEKAFASLPYECYWSFALRGGLAVSSDELESDRPYTDKNTSVNDYAWGYGADSSNGKVQRIGLKKPNPLGFFDMLGNVQEYMEEPFQATSAYELSAQKGGSTLRGGSIFTPFDRMSNSNRTEKKRYTNSKPTRAKDTGMRLMLNVSVTQDLGHLKSLQKDVDKKNELYALIKDRKRYITPEKAIEYQGKNKTVCGTVFEVTVKNNLMFLNFGGSFPYHVFTILLNKQNSEDARYYEKKTVCAKGVIKTYKGKAELTTLESIEVLE